MPRRTTPADAIPIRVVVVTMDSHLTGAAMGARAALRRELPGLDLAVHAADEWGGDPAALEACRADIARADIVIATMLFLDDHIRAVLPALEARRAQCDAMLCMMSAGEVMRLTRLGRFSMSDGARGPLALLRRLRGKPSGSGSSGRGQMRMLRRLPHILRFIPGTAQDVRAYFLALQYWLGGSQENIADLVRMLVGRYAAGARAALAGAVTAAPPIAYPEVGLYHPRARGRIWSASPTCRPRRAAPARSACCCCAPTCSPATPRITTAPSPRWRRGGCASSPPSPRASTRGRRSSAS